MDVNATQLEQVTNELANSIGGDFGEWLNSLTHTALISFAILAGIVVLVYLIQAVLIGALARGKGYSFFGNFVLGLFFGFFALVYEAGRPVSYERECVMQDRLAMQTAKELYKLQRAKEKARAGTSQI